MSSKEKTIGSNENVVLPAEQRAISASRMSLYSLDSQTDVAPDRTLVYKGTARPQLLPNDDIDIEKEEPETELQAEAHSNPSNTDDLRSETSATKTANSNQIALLKQPQENYVLGIIDYSNSCGKISPDHHAALDEAFKESVARLKFEYPDTYNDIETDNFEFVDDIYLISLASVECVNVLRDLIKNMPKWPGAKLRLVSSLVLPSHSKANFCIRYNAVHRPIEEILAILARQNSGLNVDLWKIFCKVDFDDGVFIMSGIDPVSVLSLRRSQGKMLYLRSILEVNVEQRTFGEYSFKELKRNRSLALTVLQEKQRRVEKRNKQS